MSADQPVPPPAKRILAVVSDLMFQSRIDATGRAAGARVRIVRDARGLAAALEIEPADAILIDLALPPATWQQVLCDGRAAAPSAQIIAFYAHVDPAVAAQARQLGADETLSRSAFVARLPELLAAATPGSDASR